MSRIEITIPAMGEGITEATIIKWLVDEGSQIEEDTPVAEIATDKVDSEIHAPASGVIYKILRFEGEIPRVGEVIAVISTNGENIPIKEEKDDSVVPNEMPTIESIREKNYGMYRKETEGSASEGNDAGDLGTSLAIESPQTFLSPLIRNIAEKLNISVDELAKIKGSSKSGRITRDDLYRYIELKTKSTFEQNNTIPSNKVPATQPKRNEKAYLGNINKVVEMDHRRKLIADHMVYSKQVAPHVTSFHETDLTTIVNWRNKVKEDFFKKYGTKLTYTPIFIEALVNTLKEFPALNISVDNQKIIFKSDLNIGMATALPDGNLIVPVIKEADKLSLSGLASAVNDLASRARKNRLQPHEIQGGTFTITNLGAFGNLTGTPIINQPEIAIVAVGSILKKPAVVEEDGTLGIAIRDICMLSMAYDHRVIDGVVGGMFLQRISQFLEGFDFNREI